MLVVNAVHSKKSNDVHTMEIIMMLVVNAVHSKKSNDVIP